MSADTWSRTDWSVPSNEPVYPRATWNHPQTPFRFTFPPPPHATAHPRTRLDTNPDTVSTHANILMRKPHTTGGVTVIGVAPAIQLK